MKNDSSKNIDYMSPADRNYQAMKKERQLHEEKGEVPRKMRVAEADALAKHKAENPLESLPTQDPLEKQLREKALRNELRKWLDEEQVESVMGKELATFDNQMVIRKVGMTKDDMREFAKELAVKAGAELVPELVQAPEEQVQMKKKA